MSSPPVSHLPPPCTVSLGDFPYLLPGAPPETPTHQRGKPTGSPPCWAPTSIVPLPSRHTEQLAVPKPFRLLQSLALPALSLLSAFAHASPHPLPPTAIFMLWSPNVLHNPFKGLLASPNPSGLFLTGGLGNTSWGEGCIMVDSVFSTPTILGVFFFFFFKNKESFAVFFPTDLKVIQPIFKMYPLRKCGKKRQEDWPCWHTEITCINSLVPSL